MLVLGGGDTGRSTWQAFHHLCVFSLQEAKQFVPGLICLISVFMFLHGQIVTYLTQNVVPFITVTHQVYDYRKENILFLFTAVLGDLMCV